MKRPDATFATELRQPLRLLVLLASALAVLSVERVSAEASSHGPPPGYYAPAQGLTGDALRDSLHDIIDGHARQTYTTVWTILEDADSAADLSDNVLTIYMNALRPKADHNTWNREHSWPKSYGFETDSKCNYPYTDAHHLFAADPGYNSSRNQGAYDNCPDHSDPAVCVSKPADGHPAEEGNYRRAGSGEWEVWRGRRGDIARAMFYMDVRYEGGPSGLPGCSGDDELEPDLVLTSDLSLVATTSRSPAYMGQLDTLLEWSDEDPVDEREERRNDVVYGYQGNRNPFVDHPEWVATLWPLQQTVTPTLTITPTPTVTATATMTSTLIPTVETPSTPVLTATATHEPGASIYLPLTQQDHWLHPPTATPTASNTPVPPTATQTLVPTNTQPPTPTPTFTQPPPASLSISGLQCEGSDEWVRVRNSGGTAAQLSGWKIISVVGPQTFTFPAYTLDPGAAVTVHSGPDAPPTGGSVLRWTGAYIWNNDGDSAELRNPGGSLVDDRDC